MENHPRNLLNLVLPEIIVTYFELQKYEELLDAEGEEELHLYYDEKNEVPVKGRKEHVVSKGFYPISKVQDFPIRGKSVYLHIRRRKWWSVERNKTITRDWELVAKGTRMTASFAHFLKEAYR